jgi:hypothetical protein
MLGDGSQLVELPATFKHDYPLAHLLENGLDLT